MKKLLLALVVLLTLSACQSAGYSKVSEGETVLFTGKTAFTKNDLYKKLKVTGEEAMENIIIEKIAEIEGVDVEEEKQALLDELQASGYYDYYIAYYFGTEEALINYFYNDMVITALEKKDAESNYEAKVEEYTPVKMMVATFEDSETANKVIEAVKAGKTMGEACIENGYTYEPTSSVYLDNDDTLTMEVKAYLSETDVVGISDVITSSTTSTDADGNEVQVADYYVLFIESRNADDFKEDFLNTVVNEYNADNFKNELFAKHEVKFYDQDLYEIMSNANEAFK